MKKLLFIPLFSFGIATYPDFSMCYSKYKNLSIIPISKKYSITSIPQKNYIKYYDNLGIYLVKNKTKNIIHFKKSHLGVWIASITKNSIYSGNYAEYQTSLQNPAKISTKTKPASIITDIFCNPIGIGVKDGFFSKSYIPKLLSYTPPKQDYLKFLGILYDKNLKIIKILPNSIAQKHFIPLNSKIIKVNNIKVYTPSDIKKALNNKKNVTITLEKNGIRISMPLRK
jgi:quinolinate synthase